MGKKRNSIDVILKTIQIQLTIVQLAIIDGETLTDKDIALLTSLKKTFRDYRTAHIRASIDAGTPAIEVAARWNITNARVSQLYNALHKVSSR